MAIQYNSNFDLTIPMSDVCAQVGLTANVPQSFTLPGAATKNYSVRFSYAADANVFVRFNTAATTPAANSVGTEAYCEFRPGADGSQRYARGGDVIHFSSPDATGYVGISVRSIP